MVARTETPNASLPWLVRITANCPNLLDAPKRRLPSTLHWGGQRVILATISTHSGGDGMVLHLADKTSANTTSPANSMLARAFGAMYDLLLGKGALPCPSRNSRNSSTATI